MQKKNKNVEKKLDDTRCLELLKIFMNKKNNENYYLTILYNPTKVIFVLCFGGSNK